MKPARLTPRFERFDSRFDPTSGPRPAYSRALLTPGPLPPLSHLGVTLLRHAAGTGLRYSLYHLGLPIRRRRRSGSSACASIWTPGAPPAAHRRARRCRRGGRPDRARRRRTLPGAAGALPAALAFHRLRLFRFRPPSFRTLEPRGSESAEELWKSFRSHFSRLMTRVNDAFLADLIASLDRRAARAAGEEAPPVLSRAAWQLRTGGEADLRLFGSPDLLGASWSEMPERARAAREALAPHAVPGYDRHRGRFREAWRALLTQLKPLYRALARSAAGRGLVDGEEDAYFLPFDLAGALAGARRPAWLDAAVRANRAEYDSLRAAAEPLDLMTEKQEMAPPAEQRPEWDWAPLLPLP